MPSKKSEHERTLQLLYTLGVLASQQDFSPMATAGLKKKVGGELVDVTVFDLISEGRAIVDYRRKRHGNTETNARDTKIVETLEKWALTGKKQTFN
jgi:hypothetical protein